MMYTNKLNIGKTVIARPLNKTGLYDGVITSLALDWRSKYGYIVLLDSGVECEVWFTGIIFAKKENNGYRYAMDSTGGYWAATKDQCEYMINFFHNSKRLGKAKAT